MSDVLPAPYPADTKAKGWRFELDLEKVRQSDTWALAGPALRPWLLMMWSVAWEQVPCGSLPADDELIAARLEMPLEQFQASRAKLLRGWWLADDGRLYHSTIVSRVEAMLDKRRSDADRAARSRASRSGGDVVSPDSDASNGSVTRDADVTQTGLGGEFDTKHQAPSTSNTPPSLRSGGKRAAKPRATLTADDVVTDSGADLQHVRDWFRIRKVPLTGTAWAGFKANAEKAGITPAQAVQVCAKAEWRGFDPTWNWQKFLDGQGQQGGKHAGFQGKDYSKGVDGDGYLN